MKKKMIDIGDDSFEKTVSSENLVLVDFWADWCEPCKTFSHILENFTAEQANILVAKVNVSYNPIIVAKYEIRSIPTLMLFRKNQILQRKVGVMSKLDIMRMVKKYANFV